MNVSSCSAIDHSPVLVMRGGLHAARLALSIRSCKKPATFASPAPKPQNAKLARVFRALLVGKPRKIKAQTRRDLRRMERVLRHINGAPRRRTQKQNSKKEISRVAQRSARRSSNSATDHLPRTTNATVVATTQLTNSKEKTTSDFCRQKRSRRQKFRRVPSSLMSSPG